MSTSTADRDETTESKPPARRIGVVGGVALAGLAIAAVALFVNFSNRTPAERSCRGSGVPAAGASSRPSAEAAIAAFASNPSLPRWQRTAVDLPADRWLRRNGNLYENTVDGDRVVMLDVGETDGAWTVSGLWICAPVEA